MLEQVFLKLFEKLDLVLWKAEFAGTILVIKLLVYSQPEEVREEVRGTSGPDVGAVWIAVEIKVGPRLRLVALCLAIMLEQAISLREVCENILST
jgi:hypothetical protein